MCCEYDEDDCENSEVDSESEKDEEDSGSKYDEANSESEHSEDDGGCLMMIIVRMVRMMVGV